MAHAQGKGKKAPLLPKLRFKVFAGDGEWEEKIFESLYTFQRTNSFSRENLNYNEGFVKNIHYGDIHTKFSPLFDITNEIVPYVNNDVCLNDVKGICYCTEGDLIIADASEDLNDIGKSIEIVKINNERVISGQHTLLARPNRGTFCVGFCGHLFQTTYIRSQMQNQAQGTKILGLSVGRVSKISVCYPPYSSEQKVTEQQRIADCLTSLDETITAESQKLEALTAHKKALVQKLFPAEGEKVPALRFKEFAGAGEWKKEGLGSYTVKVGSGITPRGGEKNYIKTGRPFIRSQNIGWGQLLLDDVAFINEATHNSFSSTEINNNDVLLNITGASIGRCALADFRIEGGNVNQHVCIIRTKKNKLAHNFLCQYILSEFGQKQIDSFQAGGNRQGLNFEQIKSFSIPIPHEQDHKPREQQRIADCLTSLDELITAHTRKIDLLKEHKKGLMQQLFPKREEE